MKNFLNYTGLLVMAHVAASVAFAQNQTDAVVTSGSQTKTLPIPHKAPVVAPAPPVPVLYSFQTFEPPAGYYIFSINGINDLGQVVGSCFSNDRRQKIVVVWTNGQPQILPSLSSLNSTQARAINNAGAVTGFGDVPQSSGSSATHPFIWTPTTGIADLNIGSPSDNNFAQDINDAGQIVGGSWIWHPATQNGPAGYASLPRPAGATIVSGYAVNNSSTVVGDSSNGTIHRPFIYANGAPSYLASGGTPYYLNNQSEALGDASDFSAPVFWSASGALSKLPILDGLYEGWSGGISDRSEIVGSGYGDSWDDIPMYWKSPTDKPIDLNDLTSLPDGWTLTDAEAMSHGGAIAGWAYFNSDIDYHAFTLRPVPQLAVDANRDGQIHFGSEKIDSSLSDATSADKPFRFWLNDDDDGNALNNESEVVGGTAKDYESRGDFGIASKRDLEDFARLWINTQGLNDALRNGDMQIGLMWKADTVTGSPAINLYTHCEAGGGTGYLTDSAVAIQQATPPYSATMTDTTGKNVVSASNGIFVLKKEVFANLTEAQPTTHLLFEGAGIGKGMLQIVILDKNGTKIGEGPGVWLDLKNIRSMYQGPGTAFDQPADEKPQAIVFVHGWNMSPEGSRNFAETVFKRLWHRGYKGRFVYFRWNTTYSDAFDDVPVVGAAVEGYLADYNGSERVAWQSGAALKAVVDALPAGYSRNLMAHSMGNIVAGSALLSGMTVNNYVLMHAAIPASCYDDRDLLKQPQSQRSYAGINVTLWENDTPDDDPVAETRVLAYRGRLTGDRGNLISFYLPNDAATVYAWELNNDKFKPALNYGYTRGAPTLLGSQQGLWKQIGMGPSAVHASLSDPLEAMPFADASWSKLVGAESRTAGAIKGSLDLSSETFSLPGATLGFRDEHSAEFNRNIQVLQPFYQELLRALKIPQNQ
jgi:hypothetical protein